MKKGNFWPQVRTKWLSSELTTNMENPPVYAKANISGVFLYVDDLGTVFPEIIRNVDDDPARYRYNQEAGGAYWTFFGESDHFACHVQLIQTIDPATGQTVFYAEWYNVTFTGILEQVGNSTTWNGIWPYSGSDPVIFPMLFFPEINVAEIQLSGIRPVRYGELHAAGINTNDCKPLEWTSSY